ncbi:hypothetical protein VTK73DRAFT_8522 [Phialemonium thermophilum]|uniref:Transcriptional regulatory protein RXT2 N-terminal domain-containing protein n=1 Tax=Phialemonium thermophilum TaxID=223376 RepID=A0ABR3W854_9PEZI
MEAAAEDNPYSSIHLENILAPLTSVTDLPTHPTLSRPFTSKALTELAIHGRNLMHKENAALWQVRPLLTRLQGDHTWIPCGMLTQPGDIDLFADDYLTRFHPRGTGSSSRRSEGTPITNGSEKKAPPPLGPAPDAGRPGHETEDKPAATDSSAQEDGPTVNTTSEIPSDSASADKKVPLDGDQVDNNPARDEGQKEVNGAWSNGATQADTHEAAETKDQPAAGNGEADVEMSEPSKTDGIIEAHANSGSHPSESRAVSVATDGTDDLFIHPLFLPPRSAHPDRDQGLLEPEAEDIRRLLQLYVQKQEEICRGVTKLYIDLLKADRYRKTVLKWAKAEAHCGDARDMSDGEDWYDKEEWGLVEDLKKGQDEEEEDTTQPQKKTRNRK